MSAAAATEPRVYDLVTGRVERDRQRRLTYTAEEVAQLLGCSPSSVRRMARAGRIPHIAVGRNLKFPKDAIGIWIQKAALEAAGMEG